MVNNCAFVEAVWGGLIIGIAVGVYMLYARKVAGCSGCLKTFFLGSTVDSSWFFILGLIVAGVVTSYFAPDLYDMHDIITIRTLKVEVIKYVVGGVCIGVGTTLSGGCTSGHGLAGISKLSLRSVVATTTFLIFGIFTANYRKGLTFVQFSPLVDSSKNNIERAGIITLCVLILGVPLFFIKSKSSQGYAGFWVGNFFGCGLAIGGMVRPSVVLGGLTFEKLDLTLWFLFCTALLISFCFFRVAEKIGIKEARWTAKQGPIDTKLIGGAALFGIGWGLTGLCPGPLIVGLSASPTSVQPWICLFSVLIGMKCVQHFVPKTKAQKKE